MAGDPRDAFSDSAEKYLSSTDHMTGPDLDVIGDVAARLKPSVVLDVAAGAGHALRAAAVQTGLSIAADITREMLDVTVRHLRSAGFRRLTAVQADSAALPLADETASLVTCRIAAHHFPSIPRFLMEVRRVMKPDGAAVIIDSTVPEDPYADTFLNVAEAFRDPSHLRSHRLTQWIAFLHQAALRMEMIETFRRRHPFQEWARRMLTDEEAVLRLEDYFLEAPDDIQEVFRVEVAQGRVVSYTDWKTIFVLGKE